MSSLDKLCFILVERQKANALRRKKLYAFYGADKNLKKQVRSKHGLKKKQTAKSIKIMKDSHTEYRRIADLMNEQRPLLRQLRKDAGGAVVNYNGSNECESVTVDKVTYNWAQITQLHNTYVFESTVLKDGQISNPYAKELYGKETKQEENN